MAKSVLTSWYSVSCSATDRRTLAWLLDLPTDRLPQPGSDSLDDECGRLHTSARSGLGTREFPYQAWSTDFFIFFQIFWNFVNYFSLSEFGSIKNCSIDSYLCPLQKKTYPNSKTQPNWKSTHDFHWKLLRRREAPAPIIRKPGSLTDLAWARPSRRKFCAEGAKFALSSCTH